jgi:hypothetical protein
MKREKKASTQLMTVTASIDEMMFLEELIKHMADTMPEKQINKEHIQLGWESIGTSSIEAYVSGNVMISADGKPARVPYMGCFLFTCVKECRGKYTLEGSFSLS